MKIGILEGKDFSREAMDCLKKIGRVCVFNGGDLGSFLKEKEIIFVRLNYYIGKDFLDSANKLKYICTPTTGLNHLDMKEIKKRDITVVSLKGEDFFLSSIRATPEHALGLALSLLRNYKECFLNKKNRKWNRDLFKGNEIYKKNIGIIGFGRIGRLISKYLFALGANVFFYDIKADLKSHFGEIKSLNLKEMIKKSDLIFLCASYSDEYRNFFDKKYIDLLKNKYFINISRGELVDERYLIKKIKINFFKGIALDVINNENGNNNLKELIQLIKNNNFILTPHIGGATYESMTKTEVFIANKLLKLYI